LAELVLLEKQLIDKGMMSYFALVGTCTATNRDSRSNERSLDWPGTVARTGALIRHVHELGLKTQRAVTGS
jgi:hypothetical protein